MANKYSIISFIIMAVLGITTSVIYFSENPQNMQTAHLSSQPDAIMENITAITMDKQGKPNMKIVSPRMLHFADNNTTQLIDPELTLYRKSSQPWFIKARHAKAIQGADKVDFWDNVSIHHAADESNPATLIKTPTLTVHPDKQIAMTEDLITMVQPNLTVKATGMHADMNTGDIKLISSARGEYVPTS
jgi:lipopolysaccharide export system protein LptC